jgi:hypothetical protein
MTVDLKVKNLRGTRELWDFIEEHSIEKDQIISISHGYSSLMGEYVTLYYI